MAETLRIAVRKFAPFESAIVRQFEDFRSVCEADIALEVEAMDLNPLHEAVIGSGGLARGDYDIAFINTDWLAEAQAAGALENLLPHLERSPIPDFPQGWSPSLVELQHFAGGCWGMPYHDGPECLIFRRDLLEQAGIAVPTTWEDYHEAARALHAPDEGRYGTVLALYPDGHNSFYDFCIQIWSRGGEVFDQAGRPLFTSAQAHDALDFIRGLACDERAIAPGARDTDSVGSGLLFCEGKVGLMANWFGFAALGETMEGSAVKGLVDVAPLPAGPGGRSVSLNVFWLLVIGAGSPRKDLAWAFLRHCATPAMDKITMLEGAIGVRRSTWADPEVNAQVPYCHRLDWLHEHARQLPLLPQLAAISHVVDDLLTDAVTGDKPTAMLLSAAQAKAMELLA